MKQVFETACHYLNSLIDAQTEANSGCRHGEQLISDNDIVSAFRQQITSSGIAPSSTDTYDRILYDTLLRPIATNRRDPTKYLKTKNITELSGLCVHTLSSARAAHWHPPNTETKEERDRNRRRQAQPDTAPPNPQQGNYSYHIPVQSGNEPPVNYGAPVAQHGNFGANGAAPPAPGPGAAPQRFVHPSFGGSRPSAPPARGRDNRIPNPDGTLNCFSCGKTHKDLQDCPLHFSKVGQSPFRGATDSQGRLLCLGCGSANHRMSTCATPDRLLLELRRAPSALPTTACLVPCTRPTAIWQCLHLHQPTLTPSIPVTTRSTPSLAASPPNSWTLPRLPRTASAPSQTPAS